MLKGVGCLCWLQEPEEYLLIMRCILPGESEEIFAVLNAE